MKTSELMANTVMRIVPKARNLHWMGWHAGYLAVQFFDRPTIYIFGPDIPARRNTTRSWPTPSLTASSPPTSRTSTSAIR